ncbi:MAG: polynucleotide kinase-phosphatase [Gemmatimonadota bacterium]|nr:polynucleotide kinase-phosphatase [Gemmatimonadota bacterium]
MTVAIPELAVVVLIGPSGSGKSTFARRHFLATEVLSSDTCRGLVADDENDQSATTAAFEVLHHIAGVRLRGGRLTVVDATNVQAEARKPLMALARQYHAIPVAIVFDVPERVCQERNRARPDRAFGRHVIRQQRSQLRRALRSLKREGFRHIHVFTSPDDVERVTIARQPLWNNRRDEHGPFDIIGDVHGCCSELEALLSELGYVRDEDGVWGHPEGRMAVFVGDLVDRGPRIPATLRLVMDMVTSGHAHCVPGNHDMKLVKALRGKQVRIAHGLDRSLEQLAQEPEAFRDQVLRFLDGLVSHYVFDDGKLVVAHAGMKEELQGRGSGAVRAFALYGETTGESDEFGLPIRYDWASEYRGSATVVYGHTPVPEAEWVNRTINIDTGCVFGGRLTALRYPERELVSVRAAQMYAEPAKPIGARSPPAGRTAQQVVDDVLDIADVTGKRIIPTGLKRNVTIREENGIAALEVISRFAVDPRWLIYLPPTMSPTETSKRDGVLEHPDEAFRYFQANGVEAVVCEEKHMGSRAVIVVCRDEAAAHRRFGAIDGGIGACYTRTGRRFFESTDRERELLETVQRALEASGFWEKHETDWVCLDCELMPWSEKARELIRQQYAAVGAAAQAALSEVLEALSAAKAGGGAVDALLDRYAARARNAAGFTEAYARYCWDVGSLEDLKLAPFHVMATEGAVHSGKDHRWHLEAIGEVVEAAGSVLMRTAQRTVRLDADREVGDAVSWWEGLTGGGGEGMVVKPSSFVAYGRRGLLQPAVKVRGREYLRIIYGPDYTESEHLARLRSRALGRKRSLALREFALGLEGLDRFVRREPLRRVHECAFGVLALESEPVDPRL